MDADGNWADAEPAAVGSLAGSGYRSADDGLSDPGPSVSAACSTVGAPRAAEAASLAKGWSK
eukprot:10989783-Lingulodinium_polyedra.AAC.1